MEPDAATAIRATVSPAGPASAASARPDAAPPTPVPTAPEILNLLQKNWGWMLGRQLQQMVNNRQHEARINVNPAQLGPIEVRISFQQHQANIMFFSHDAAVREALESAMPRLRELLDGQGLQLNQTQVSDQPASRQQSGWGEQAAKQRDGGSAAGSGTRESAEDDADASPPTRQPQGMVDHYV
ncbi:MAG: flagellar hook-length control protein FliK [Candidatus Competibacteraceae bacterium]|nr:MAG: flagellar hook-length control protein FliK [Candidatus Competibacteraceae bacterium]